MPVSARLTIIAATICGLCQGAAASDAGPFRHSVQQAGTTWEALDVSWWLNSEPQWLLTGWTDEFPAEDSLEAERPTESTHVPQLNPAAEMGPATSPVLPPHRLISQSDSSDAADEEEEALDVTVSELFEPMGSVRVTGPSSIPPTLEENEDVVSLPEPDDQAGPYMESSVRACYYTLGYGVRRPPRNTWRFYCHPLYYEEVNLERCGRSKGCCTTACSALHFASRAAITPYLMTLQHHDDCVCTLPDCPTCHKFGCDATCPKWSWKAALVQGAAVTGLVYAIP